MKMKIKIYAVLIVLIGLLFTACEKMDYNYSQYLEDVKVYSPKVRNLRSYPALREVTLAWDNPPGSTAKQIVIDYQDKVITTETMVDTIRITNLEIKGYDFLVYTKDAFGNLSVAESIIVFPNGEVEE